MGHVSIHTEPKEAGVDANFLRIVDEYTDQMSEFLKQKFPGAAASENVRRYCRSFRQRFASMVSMAVAKRAESILSIGVSFGLPEAVMANEFGARVVGTDYRPEKTDVWAAAASARKVNVVQFDVVKQSVRELGQHGPFDLIWCCEVLEHLRIPPELIVRELCELLSEDGKILLTVPNVGRLANLRKLIRGRNIIAPLASVDRADLANGKTVFDRWIHVREPSIHEFVEMLQGNTPSEFDWQVWLPSSDIGWRNANMKGIAGAMLQRSFPRLRSTIFGLGGRRVAA